MNDRWRWCEEERVIFKLSNIKKLNSSYTDVKNPSLVISEHYLSLSPSVASISPGALSQADGTHIWLKMKRIVFFIANFKIIRLESGESVKINVFYGLTSARQRLLIFFLGVSWLSRNKLFLKSLNRKFSVSDFILY